jgi:hypothetical protein
LSNDQIESIRINLSKGGRKRKWAKKL